MKHLRQFFNTVPKSVQLWASVLAACIFLTGLSVAFTTASRGTLLRTLATYGSAALVFGFVSALCLMGLGFVFADARRRDMRAVLWVLVAMLFPHLLGFLLYFVMRQPIAAACPHCGAFVTRHQQFCSGCGNRQPALDATDKSFTSNPPQGASQ